MAGAALPPLDAQDASAFSIPRAKQRDPRILSTNPTDAFWAGAARIETSQDRYGKPIAGARTVVRGAWTKKYLYLLFSSQFEKMKLKVNPSRRKETWGLWDYDVVEVFIGWELDQIGRYKEFEFSPQSEWVDLDVDRDRKGKHIDWEWDAVGMQWDSRVDETAKQWHCAIRIPWRAIDGPGKKPAAGREFSLNLYRIEGDEPNRKYLTWRAVNSPSYHTPEAFGRLKLVE